MAKLLATRSTQTPQIAEFIFNWNDWVVDTVDGTKKTLGSTVALSKDPTESGLTGPVANTIVFDFLKLPYGAVITGGEVIVETAYAGATAATLIVGIAGNTAIYLASNDLKAAANTRSPLLLLTALGSNGGQDLRATIAYTVANATAGKIRVRVEFTVDGKAHEVYV